jgi:hypothetical protein
MGYSNISIGGSDVASDLNAEILDILFEEPQDDACEYLIELLKKPRGTSGYNTPDTINVPLVVREHTHKLKGSKIFPELLKRCVSSLGALLKEWQEATDENFGNVEAKAIQISAIVSLLEYVETVSSLFPYTGELPVEEKPKQRYIKKVMIYAKCADKCNVQLFSREGKFIAERDGYPPESLKFGTDEVAFEVDLYTGRILNWIPPTDLELMADFELEPEAATA